MGAGLAGVSVDLGQEPRGWVDMLHLPEDPDRWPPLGRAGFFEVLQHRPGEVRLFPLDAGMRATRCLASRWSGPERAAITRRYPIGSLVVGTVTDVFPGNRECLVACDDFRSSVEYDDVAPVIGTSGVFAVRRLPEWTRRIVLEFADSDASNMVP